MSAREDTPDEIRQRYQVGLLSRAEALAMLNTLSRRLVFSRDYSDTLESYKAADARLAKIGPIYRAIRLGGRSAV